MTPSGETVTVAYDTGDFVVEGGTPDTDYTFADDVLTIKTETPLTVSMAEGKASTDDRIEVTPQATGTAKLVLDGVSIDTSSSGTPALSVLTGGLDLTLTVDNSLTSGGTCAGLQNGTNPLAIRGDGSLVAIGGEGGAGIGGRRESPGSTITIEGGTITARGGNSGNGYGGAGIGGGKDCAGTTIVIKGGAVVVTGGVHAAGIGGGYGGAGSNISISGGTVTATGGSSGAGIGGGIFMPGAHIAIKGGTVTATGGFSGDGIGGGQQGQAGCSGNTISGGRIAAAAGHSKYSALRGFAAGSITGGAFADKDALSDGATSDTVYGVKLDDSHIAAANNVEGEEDYPVRVYEMKDPSYSNKFGDSPKIVTYNGGAQSIDVTDLKPNRGGVAALDAYVTYAPNGSDKWATNVPVDAGWYNVRHTIPQAVSNGVWWREKTFDISASSASVLQIDPAQASYTAPTLEPLQVKAGTKVSDLIFNLKNLATPTYKGAGNADSSIPGIWSWAEPDKALSTADTSVEAVFTPSNVSNFTWNGIAGWDSKAGTLTVDIPVTVFEQTPEPEPDPDPVVPPSRPAYSPTVPETDGGNVSVSPPRPHKGDDVTVAPKPEEGQEVRDVVVTDEKGNEIEVTQNEGGTWDLRAARRQGDDHGHVRLRRRGVLPRARAPGCGLVRLVPQRGRPGARKRRLQGLRGH